MQDTRRWYRRYWKRIARRREIDPMEYRIPMMVTEHKQFNDLEGYWVCPRCHQTMDRDYQDFCDRCGQCLDWELVDED